MHVVCNYTSFTVMYCLSCSTLQSFLYGDGIGTIMVIPQQTIILDRTQCNVPEFPTVPMPTRLPPPQPVAPDASSVCVSLHKLAQDIYVTSPVFRCELNDACESGFTCVLNVVFTEYKVDIKITNNSVIFSIFSIDGKTSYGEFKGNTTFRLPEPRGAYLDFKQNVDGQKVGFMVMNVLLVFQVLYVPSHSSNDSCY